MFPDISCVRREGFIEIRSTQPMVLAVDSWMSVAASAGEHIVLLNRRPLASQGYLWFEECLSYNYLAGSSSWFEKCPQWKFKAGAPLAERGVTSSRLPRFPDISL